MQEAKDVEIRQMLVYLDHLGDLGRQLNTLSPTPAAEIEWFAAKRVLQESIDTVTEVADRICEGYLMRDPADYADMITILRQEKVIDPQISTALIALVNLKTAIQRQYYSLTKEQVQQGLVLLNSVPQYTHAIRAFLEQPF
ncbi:MAG: DUF86 domain-containing protein [Firmicutes bacterium]|nr:DUF86 domain-containing protein [Bacillota bacterium]